MEIFKSNTPKLTGHTSCHRHAGMEPKSTRSPPAIVADLPVSLLGPRDEKPSPMSWETQCLHCSKEFSTCQSLSGSMRMHSQNKVMAKLDEEPAGMMEASANANGDHGHNMMLFSPAEGHTSCHRHAGMEPKSTPSPPAIVADLPVSLLGPRDEKPSPISLETQCLHCSKEFSTCQSLSGSMRMHSQNKVMAKLDEEPAGMMEASANANGDHGHNVMLFSPEKGPKVYSCSNCGKLFKSPAALGGHRSRGCCQSKVAVQKANRAEVQESMSGELLNEARKYYCKNCGIEYDTFQKLGWHRSKCNAIVQSGPEKHYCKHCGKSFRFPRSVTSHMGHCKQKKALHNSARRVMKQDLHEKLCTDLADKEDVAPQGEKPEH